MPAEKCYPVNPRRGSLESKHSSMVGIFASREFMTRSMYGQEAQNKKVNKMVVLKLTRAELIADLPRAYREQNNVEAISNKKLIAAWKRQGTHTGTWDWDHVIIVVRSCPNDPQIKCGLAHMNESGKVECGDGRKEPPIADCPFLEDG